MISGMKPSSQYKNIEIRCYFIKKTNFLTSQEACHDPRKKAIAGVIRRFAGPPAQCFAGAVLV
jgi:hypothetical protein